MSNRQRCLGIYWNTFASLLLLAVYCALLFFSVADGAVFTIGNGADSGTGSLRDIVSNNITNGDTILFQSGLTIALSTSSPVITVLRSSVKIIGPVTITGGSSNQRLLEVQGSDVLIRDITFTSVDVSSTTILTLSGHRAVVQGCSFIYASTTASAIFFGAAVDSVLIG